ncbi:hypothetical protein [Macrococcus bovicus]|uniref:hypothetical protein n=1 Tax=Macrococcus bovicus TaxID=69968 RepID=UPI0025A5E1D4|nr:hypothetical protein [Macrococcus bovicus]WJP97103.1 hypothetical protein QSV55_07400 [Macrococcus bovicus]
MKEQFVKRPVIYYYLDRDGNRRPIDYRICDGFDYAVDDQTIKHINDFYPETTNNLYVIIEGFEFRLA